MAKSKNSYVCQNCGEAYSSWSGKCATCGEWNSLKEFNEPKLDSRQASIAKTGTVLKSETGTSAKELSQTSRIAIGMSDIDEVLGGGIVPGSLTLIAGQPGIGKSTLLLQIAHLLSRTNSLLYVSGEESVSQISLRASRLFPKGWDVPIVTSNSANDVYRTILEGGHDIVIVDSIQTVIVEEATGIQGSISQVTNSAQLLMSAAKQSNTAVILVGHVNKEGSIAGPKVLEHLVDVVVHLEGDRYGGLRVLRGIKNRYGSTNEAAILEMTDKGLQAVKNPSAILLAERQVSDGSVVLATLEGTRPLLVEVQALVNSTNYGYPKRASSGYDLNRLNLLVAMLDRRTKLRLSDKDIYINIVGGLKITEPAADLAVCVAIASATKSMKLNKDAVVFGEVGLSGEVRHVSSVDKRIAEANKLGFLQIVGPKLSGSQKAPDNYIEAKDVRSILNTILTKDT